jgi:hypothetical protein
MPRTVGLKGRRFLSSGGAQAFQLETEDRGPVKLIFSMALGMLAVLVQSHKRHLFLITILGGFSGLYRYKSLSFEEVAIRYFKVIVIEIEKIMSKRYLVLKTMAIGSVHVLERRKVV